MTDRDPHIEIVGWTIAPPDGIDPTQQLLDEVAIRSVTRALGWDIRPVEKQREKVVMPDTITGISQEVFGDKSYGKFALQYLDWIKSGAVLNVGEDRVAVYGSFDNSNFFNRLPTVESRIPVESHAPVSDIKRATLAVIETMAFPFTHVWHPYERYRYGFTGYTSGRSATVIGAFIPGDVTEQRLRHFLQQPLSSQGVAPVNHTFHGTTGRALDVLILASGIKESVNPNDTLVASSTVALSEVVRSAKEHGISPGKIRGLREKLGNAARKQLVDGVIEPWGEVAFEGASTASYDGESGFRQIMMDHIARSSLASVRKGYERIAPDLDAFLAQYEPA